MRQLTQLLERVELSTLAEWVGRPVYPVISALHILAISFVIAPIVIADVRLLRSRIVDTTVSFLSRIAVLGFCAACATGCLLFTVQATHYADNPAFLLKFGVLTLAGANALAFRLFQRTRIVAAAISITLWFSVLLAGRWIAFTG